ncbi:MAG: SulP family inorganic anion transporter [Atopobiaceae bacterium]|jgi:high affinity sulfate transporter 1|nr:SulP family inorganic anion transporter [Atopobiaceae bacterium]MCH4180675.1 SulP family inorganic anion transporter [Atopobiaceae bacterium]MCH4214692.1 SulP family inorganic anion transporter [Atopobiaceae bacterium]MCH4229902.1 SulP family inorganic anion transporter [Atopobiaceae bacterium]MCH4276738.1 SulP family inorganic anion transporter [Atopobiaceae bacterium]
MATSARQAGHGTDAKARVHVSLFPSLRGYKVSDLPHDAIAGLIVAALSIPVAMGYAQIAGLPPVYGLYASVFPAIVYALATGTPGVVFGMDSAASATTGSALIAMGITLGSADAVRMVPLITLVAAGFLILFALLHLGKLMDYVPIPVMVGFITGVAVLIMVTQVPKLIGTTVTTGDDFIANVVAVVSSFPQANPVTCGIGLASLAALVVCKRLRPHFPLSLVLVVVGIVASQAFDLQGQGVAVLGSISTGLPTFELPQFVTSRLPEVLAHGITLAFVVAAESLLCVNTFAMREGFQPQENRELAAFGVADVISALCGSAACSASVSRSAAGTSAGSRTQMTSLIAAVTVLAVVLFLAPLLYAMPSTILAAIVIAAMVDTVEFRKIRRLGRHIRLEFWVFLAVAVCVLFLGTIWAVVLGVVLSFACLVYRRHNPQHGLMGVVASSGADAGAGAGTGDFARLDAHDGTVAPVDGVVIYRFDQSLSFANVGALVGELMRQVGPDTRLVIADVTGVRHIDVSATDRIRELISTLERQHVEIRIVRSVAPTDSLATQYELQRIMEKDKDDVYASIAQALTATSCDGEVLLRSDGSKAPWNE